MKFLRNGLFVLIALVVIGGPLIYFQLQSMGIISRAIYETEAPVIPDFKRPAILVLSKANGFVHVDALPAGQDMLKRIAQDNNWDIFLTDNAASHNAADLKKFNVVVWNNVSGDVLTEQQRADMKAWIQQGGGWVGIHASGGDFSYQWQWYVDTLIGAQFVGHTMDPQFQDADVLVADSNLGLTAHLPSRWRVLNEEWYAFDRNPREEGHEILLTLDENSYSTSGKTFFGQDSMPGEHPIAWRRQLGEGRTFYSAIGHQGATYDVPEFQQFMANAIAWAAGK